MNSSKFLKVCHELRINPRRDNRIVLHCGLLFSSFAFRNRIQFKLMNSTTMRTMAEHCCWCVFNLRICLSSSSTEDLASRTFVKHLGCAKGARQVQPRQHIFGTSEVIWKKTQLWPFKALLFLFFQIISIKLILLSIYRIGKWKGASLQCNLGIHFIFWPLSTGWWSPTTFGVCDVKSIAIRRGILQDLS